MDLVVCNFPGRPFLYRNNGNANHWLKLKLVGTHSNRSAIGAKVRLKTVVGGKTMWQMREVSASANRYSFHDSRPNFGLGGATVASVIRIEWPSGTVQELRDTGADRILTVIEPSRLDSRATITGDWVQLSVRAWRGLTYHIDASPDLTSWLRLGTLTNEMGILRFQDSASTAARTRFYRIVSPQQ
jgi:hypothetical protein